MITFLTFGEAQISRVHLTEQREYGLGKEINLTLIVRFLLFVFLFFSWDALANPDEATVIRSCYDGDTCTTTTGEKIRLACIDTPEIRGKRADPIPAKAARDYLNGLVAGEEVQIRRITKDRFGRTVAELFINGVNIQQALVKKQFASIYEKYKDQCPWALKK